MNNLVLRLEYNEKSKQFFQNAGNQFKYCITIAEGYDSKLYNIFFSYLDGAKHYTASQMIEKWNQHCIV